MPKFNPRVRGVGYQAISSCLKVDGKGIQGNYWFKSEGLGFRVRGLGG